MLTPAERGVYDTIINMIYSHGGPIKMNSRWPDLFRCDEKTLRDIIKTLTDLGKIERRYGQISIERCQTELQKSQNRIQSAVDNGKNGGRKSNKNSELQEPDGYLVGSGSEKLTSNQQPATSNQDSPKVPTEPNPPSGGIKSKERKSGVRRRLPEDWEPGEAGYRYAEELGLTRDEIDVAFRDFREFFLGKGTAWADWHLAWCRWARETVDRGDRSVRRSSDRKGPGDKLFEGAWRAAEAFADRFGEGDEAAEPLLDSGRPGRGKAGAD